MKTNFKFLFYYFFILFAGCGIFSGDNDDSSPSNSIATLPSAPSNISVTAANQKVTLTWDAVDGATSYNLYYGTDSGVNKETGTKVFQVTSPFTLFDLQNNTTYYLVLTSENSNGESDISTESAAMPEARWERLSEGQNICDSNGILSAVAMSGNGDLYGVCGYGGFEGHQWLDVRKWDGSNWIKMGENIERKDIVYPLWVNYNQIKLVVEDEVPWISWGEDIYGVGEVYIGGYLKVAYWDGTSWVQKGDTLNLEEAGLNISETDLAVNGTTPYWVFEHIVTGEDEDIYVYYWDGSQWTRLGDRLDLANGSIPQITFEGNTPYVAWQEYDTTAHSSTFLMKYWDGSTWVQLGNGISPSDGWLWYYSLKLHNGIPYVAWIGTETHVSAWDANNATWITDAYTIVQGIYPSPAFYLRFIGSTPYIIGYGNNDKYIAARYWDGSSWKEVNSEIETNQATQIVYAVSNGKTLCIFWNNTTDSDNIDSYAGCVP